MNNGYACQLTIENTQVSRNTNNLWAGVASESFPDLSAHQLDTLFVFAVSDWGVGKETELTDLYEKYRMLCELTRKSE